MTQEPRCRECGLIRPAEAVFLLGREAVCGSCKPLFLRRIKQGTLPDRDIYGSFSARLVAKVLDWMLVGFFQNMLFFLGARITGFDSDAVTAQMAVLVSLGGLLLMLLYNTLFLGHFGTTPGKMALGLVVMRADGGRLTFGRALGRAAGEYVSVSVFYLGYLMAALDPEKRALHDLIADTRVLRKDAPEQLP